ncbi:NmrA family NAD(P)-binding protein [Methylovirgula sp. 4M-Z18]|uniref:NmrA family NAD(P)-binding protein n=1 Tax=Methylovirgula sp. 4M-Z18 TaxID=2293567 RepID=UPI000E2F9195|nr:NmrA family NAD(P)-binding protein [Methylovirgula sp. 4M-Z18]RFB77979.1 NmrA family transcriptional regulator [Methylovirgula sp. 4M-Z18]
MFAILGATGNIGRSTIGELRRVGAPVRAIVRNHDAAQALRALGCEVAFADIGDSDALRNALRRATAVQVICPMSVSAEDSTAEMQSNIAAIAAALDETRPRSVLAISDYGAHHASGTGIALIFRHLEDALKKLNVSLTLLRSAEHMQNWRRLARRAITSGVLPSLHHPTTKRFPTVFASDVGAIAADLLKDEEQALLRVVHVEGPERYSAEDVARVLGELAGRPIVARELPQGDWAPALVGGGLSADYADLVAKMYAAHNAGRIDVEQGVGETRFGKTGLRQARASMIAAG